MSSRETTYKGLTGFLNLSPCCPLWSHVGSLPSLCPPSTGHPGTLSFSFSSRPWSRLLSLPNSSLSPLSLVATSRPDSLEALRTALSRNPEVACFSSTGLPLPPLTCPCFSQQSLHSRMWEQHCSNGNITHATCITLHLLKVFFFFWWHPRNMKFPGQGSDPSCSYNPPHRYGNTRSLTHSAWLGIEPVFWHCRSFTIDPIVCHSGCS